MAMTSAERQARYREYAKARAERCSRRHQRYLNREPNIAELERAVLLMAFVVEAYSERYAPVLNSLIVDLEEARKRGSSPTERAKRILDEADADGRLAAVNIMRKR